MKKSKESVNPKSREWASLGEEWGCTRWEVHGVGGGALILKCAVVPTGGENMGMKYLTCIFLTYIVVQGATVHLVTGCLAVTHRSGYRTLEAAGWIPMEVAMVFTMAQTARHKRGIKMWIYCCSVTVSDSFRSHGLQNTRPPCLSLSPGICPSLCPLNQWCHTTISSSATLFSFCLIEKVPDARKDWRQLEKRWGWTSSKSALN